MTIAFISDLHLSADRPASIALFTKFMQQTVMDELYILGDFFDYWIGDDGARELGFQTVEDVVKTAVDNGTIVTFMAGNRDFLVGEGFCERTGIKLIEDLTLIDLDGQRALLSHGDVFCTDDLEHVALRKTLLSSQWQGNILSQSIEHRLAFAKDIREQSEAAKQGKTMEVMDVNQSEVEQAIAKFDADLLIHGHTHRPNVHSHMVNGKEVKRYVLGDWYDHKSALTYSDGELNLEYNV
ncbi:MAG: UDP-2,3-diacylglucosamine hydrolase [Saprospiraceae bacterium]|jgi:UDP-2,3-diacylglucosamine hydrolase